MPKIENSFYKSPFHNIFVGTSVTTSLFQFLDFFCLATLLPNTTVCWILFQSFVPPWSGCTLRILSEEDPAITSFITMKYCYVSLSLPWPWWTLTPFFSVTSSTSLGILWMLSSPDNDNCTTDIFQWLKFFFPLMLLKNIYKASFSSL